MPGGHRRGAGQCHAPRRAPIWPPRLLLPYPCSPQCSPPRGSAAFRGPRRRGEQPLGVNHLPGHGVSVPAPLPAARWKHCLTSLPSPPPTCRLPGPPAPRLPLSPQAGQAGWPPPAERRRWVQAAARLLISAVPGFSARKPAGKGEQQAKHRAAGRGSEARPLPSPPSPSPGRSRPRARRFPLCLANTVASRHHLSGRGCILQNPCHFKTSGSLSQPPPKAKPSTHTGEHSPPPPPPPPLPLLRLPITNESFPFTPRTVEALMLICTHTHDDP